MHMGKKKKYSQCLQCKYFVEDDESLKNPISYCILLGININDSGDCPDFVSLSEEDLPLKRKTDPDPEPVS